MLLIITESHIRILFPSGLMKNMHDFFNNNRTFSLIILVETYLIKYFFQIPAGGNGPLLSMPDIKSTNICNCSQPYCIFYTKYQSSWNFSCKPNGPPIFPKWLFILLLKKGDIKRDPKQEGVQRLRQTWVYAEIFL